MAAKQRTVADLVGAYLVDQCTVLVDAEPLLRDREPAVHAARFAAWRLHSTLRTFVAFVDAGRAAAITDELGWFAGLLGDVRDPEALEERLLADLSNLPLEVVVGPVASQIETESRRLTEGSLGHGGRDPRRRSIPTAAGRPATVAQ